MERITIALVFSIFLTICVSRKLPTNSFLDLVCVIKKVSDKLCRIFIDKYPINAFTYTTKIDISHLYIFLRYFCFLLIGFNFHKDKVENPSSILSIWKFHSPDWSILNYFNTQVYIFRTSIATFSTFSVFRCR